MTSYVPVTGSGSPAFGFTMIGRAVHFAISRTIGMSSAGPREQLTPTASTPRPSIVRHIADTEQPVKVRMLDSKVMVTKTGSVLFSFAARTAAFVS